MESLQALSGLRRRGAEVIVVDGGSHDDTLARATPLADRVLISERGRAAQLNTGAHIARARVLLFLHADTRLPANADRLVNRALADTGHVWGRFDICIKGGAVLLPVIAWMMNHRSRLTSIATGDQAIFVTRRAFNQIGGFPPQALMEDIALSYRLKALSRPACLRQRVTTSGRRWDENGALRTVFLMWTLRLAYFCGISPARLARWYNRTRFI